MYMHESLRSTELGDWSIIHDKPLSQQASVAPCERKGCLILTNNLTTLLPECVDDSKSFNSWHDTNLCDIYIQTHFVHNNSTS